MQYYGRAAGCCAGLYTCALMHKGSFIIVYHLIVPSWRADSVLRSCWTGTSTSMSTLPICPDFKLYNHCY